MKILQFTGNLVKDAEVKVTPKGTQFLNFRVACTAKSKGEDKTDFIEVLDFNVNDIQVLAQYLKKGSHVFVLGQFDCSTSIGKDGRVYTNLSVLAKDVEFVGGGGKKDGENGAKTEDEPAISVTPQPTAAPAATDYAAVEAQVASVPVAPPAEAATGDDDDDELPF